MKNLAVKTYMPFCVNVKCRGGVLWVWISKSKKAIHMEIEKQILVNECLLGHLYKWDTSAYSSYLQ